MRKAASFYPRTAWARRAARQFVAERRIAAGGIHFRRGVKKNGAPAGSARGVAAKMLEFELAAALRDQIIELQGK